MARFETLVAREGNELLLSYGYDRALGFFAEICAPGRPSVEYDALTDNYSGLPGLLNFLVESGFFQRVQLEEALEAVLMVDTAAEIEDSDIRQIAELVERLKEAAGD